MLSKAQTEFCRDFSVESLTSGEQREKKVTAKKVVVKWEMAWKSGKRKWSCSWQSSISKLGEPPVNR